MTIVLSVFVFVFGLLIGSFLNVCIYRIPLKISVADGFSKCPTCGNRILWYDLIPVMSYLFLKGRCRHCKEKISPRYAIVEFLTGCLFLIAFLRFGASVQTLLCLVLLSCLIVLSFIDAAHKMIPDRFVIIILILAILNTFFAKGDYLSHIIGFFAVSVPFLLIGLVTGGMGGGDIKLMAVAGLFLAWPNMLLALILGSFVGAIVSVIMLIQKKANGKTQIPFGPYLSIGIAISALFGSSIIQWYLGFFK